MSTVQFYGAKKTLQGARDTAIPNWAVFEGKNLHFKYDADDDINASMDFLERILDTLEESQTVARYTLKFYEELKPGQKINNDTKYNTSFNFRLTDDEDHYYKKRYDYQYHKTLQDENAELKERLQALEENDDDEPLNIGKIVQGYLDNPEKLYPILHTIGTIKALITGEPTPGMPVPASEALAGVGSVHRATGTDPTPANDEERAQRLANALNRLDRRTTKLVEYMEVLADIAEKEPNLWSMITMQLDSKMK